ncbi:MAG: penicillin-binding protein 2 [Chlorobiaceae bacterium]|nr:penicillin-binding protein 2 [Chlorobiaceae bacterium]
MDIIRRGTALVTYFFIAVFAVLIGRLFYLQAVESRKMGSMAGISSIRRNWVEPPRGRMIDRHGVVMVDNQPLYTIRIIPDEFKKNRIAFLAKLMEMPEEELADKIAKGHAFNRYTPIVIAYNPNPVIIARLTENLWQIPGVSIETENKRKYIDSLNGTHLFGYLQSISKNDLEVLAEQGYVQNDKIGYSGIEKIYEDRLKGFKGVNYDMVTPFGKFAGKYNEGKNDIPSIRGDDLYLSVDAGLQKRAEQLLRKTGKSGAVVALDPSTGGILALASVPDFSLEIFNGSTDRAGWNAVVTSPLKPLINRAVQAAYPPGSTFKMVSAMAALEEKTMDPKKKILDNGSFVYGNRRFLSNEGRGHGLCDMREAITVSSNVYFYNLMFNIGFENWTKYSRMFGFGERTGIDLPNERSGILPSTEYYDNRYGKDKWTKGYLVSLAIGQGEVGVTPVQLAAYAAAIGNRGTILQPHIVNGYRDTATGQYIPFIYAKRQLPFSKSTFDLIHDGMVGVVERGTGKLSQVPDVVVGGKTGTAQNPHGKSHAWFIAFAPAEKPKIAIAVLVENAGFGGAISAPIAGALIKYYLKGDDQTSATGTAVNPTGNAPSDSVYNDLPYIETVNPDTGDKSVSGSTATPPANIIPIPDKKLVPPAPKPASGTAVAPVSGKNPAPVNQVLPIVAKPVSGTSSVPAATIKQVQGKTVTPAADIKPARETTQVQGAVTKPLPAKQVIPPPATKPPSGPSAVPVQEIKPVKTVIPPSDKKPLHFKVKPAAGTAMTPETVTKPAVNTKPAGDNNKKLTGIDKPAGEKNVRSSGSDKLSVDRNEKTGSANKTGIDKSVKPGGGEKPAAEKSAKPGSGRNAKPSSESNPATEKPVD